MLFQCADPQSHLEGRVAAGADEHGVRALRLKSGRAHGDLVAPAATACREPAMKTRVKVKTRRQAAASRQMRDESMRLLPASLAPKKGRPRKARFPDSRITASRLSSRAPSPFRASAAQ